MGLEALLVMVCAQWNAACCLAHCMSFLMKYIMSVAQMCHGMEVQASFHCGKNSYIVESVYYH